MTIRTPGASTGLPPRTFVMVHGAFRGGWCYGRVADQLRAHGHHVFTPTLTGLGERSHLANFDVTCSTHINDILNVIKWEKLRDVVLCGHSYGGIIIGGVADLVPDLISSLVFIDANIPEDGKSALDLIEPSERTMIVEAAAEQGGRFLSPLPAVFFGVNDADRQMVDELSTPHPVATLSEKLKLTGSYLDVEKKIYIRATRWAGTMLERSYAHAKKDPAWSVFEIPCGHDVMLNEPESLKRILLESI